MDDWTGRILGGYRLDKELGRGGSGRVFRARDLSMRRDVALKILDPRPGSNDLVRWRMETWAGGRLEHPHIARVHAAGSDQGLHFLAMELCAGGSLGAALDGGPIERRRAVSLVCQVAGATAHAHAKGVLHRDIKPANILLDATGNHALLADFGLARLTDETVRCTATGDVLGTLCYMSPEQLEGTGPLGPPADVYALGVVLYEVLTGELPYYSPRLATLARAVLDGRLVPPRTRDPSIPKELDAICQRALGRELARRYASAGELAADLERFLAGDPVSVRAPTLGARLARRVARHRRLIAAAALSAATSFALALHAARADEAERRGEAERVARLDSALARASAGDRAALEQLEAEDPPPERSAEVRAVRARAWRAIGDDLHARRALDGAGAAYHRAIELGGAVPAVSLAAVALAQGRAEDALARLANAAGSADELALEVDASLAADQPERAARAALRLAGVAPARPGRALLEARVFRARGLLADALVALSSALERDPHDRAARGLRVEIRLALRDGDAAAADLALLAAAGEPDPAHRREQALLWSGRLDPDRARAANLRLAGLARIARGASPAADERAALLAAERAAVDAILDPTAPWDATADRTVEADLPAARSAGARLLLARALGQLAKGDLAVAAALARLAAIEQPASAAPLELLADIDRRAGRIDAARARYAQIARARPNDARPRLAGARLAIDAADPRGALALLAGAGETWSPIDAAAAERLSAEAWLAAGEPETARTLAARLRAADPTDLAAARLDALALRQLGREQEARTALAEVAQLANLGRGRREELERLARQAAHAGDHGRAIDRATELVQRSPGDAAALFLRATHRLRSLRPDQLAPALADLLRALELDPRLRLQIDEALGRLVAIARREVVLGAAATLSGATSIGLGERDASAADATGDARPSRAQNAGDADAALLSAEIHRALARCPGATPEDRERARHDYERALALAPAHYLARWSRARFLLEAGQLDDAAMDLEQLDRDGPPRWDLALLQAALATRRGDPTARERHLAAARAAGLPDALARPEALLAAPDAAGIR